MHSSECCHYVYVIGWTWSCFYLDVGSAGACDSILSVEIFFKILPYKLRDRISVCAIPTFQISETYIHGLLRSGIYSSILLTWFFGRIWTNKERCVRGCHVGVTCSGSYISICVNKVHRRSSRYSVVIDIEAVRPRSAPSYKREWWIIVLSLICHN